jgi:predicted phage terminase large subunit-like protein
LDESSKQPATVIGPQKGPQEGFASTSADIAIFGGQAGGGKTFGLLMEAGIRHRSVPNFGAVIFRRTFPQIIQEGGLWDTSMELYPHLGAEPIQSPRLEWRFTSGARVGFSHMQHEKNRLDWKGAQIPLICFDQLEEFTGRQFWYLVSRNRSTCGVRPYIRATCNPVPPDDEVGGWLHELIGWWIGGDGYPVPEKSGVLRWVIRVRDKLEWFETRMDAELAVIEQQLPQGVEPLSVTFIPSALEDNAMLMEKDPGYLAKLEMLPQVERLRLRGGNWKVRDEAGLLLNRGWFKIKHAIPANTPRRVRYWDKAGTEGGKGAQTAGTLMSGPVDGRYLIEDVISGRWSALERNRTMRQVAEDDGIETTIVVEQEPGSGGKESAEITIRDMAGYDVHTHPVGASDGNKIVRSRPFRAQAEAGNIDLLSGEWVEGFLRQAQNFGPGSGLKDMIDSATGAFIWLTGIHDNPQRKARFR